MAEILLLKEYLLVFLHVFTSLHGNYRHIVYKVHGESMLTA